MAELIIDRNDVVVRLDRWEALVTFHREVRVPVRDLSMVHVDEEPFKGLSPWRLPGLWWPGGVVLGTCRSRGRREFAAVRTGCAAVVLETDHGPWGRVVVSSPDAVKLAADLAAVVLERGPRGGGHKSSGLGGGTLQRQASSGPGLGPDRQQAKTRPGRAGRGAVQLTLERARGGGVRLS